MEGVRRRVPLVEVGWLSPVGSPSRGGRAELAVREAAMEADTSVSRSPAPSPPTWAPFIPPESILRLLNTKEPTIFLVYMVRRPKNHPSPPWPMTTMSSLTDVGSHSHVHTLVDTTHVYTQTYFEQIFIKLPQGPGKFPDALPCPALVGLRVPGLGSLMLRVSLPPPPPPRGHGGRNCVFVLPGPESHLTYGRFLINAE